MASLIEAKDLTVGYEGKAVLSGVHLVVSPGEVVALLGPNAGGKTTLLRTLSGVLPPLHGEVSLNGKPLSQMSLIDRAKVAAYVPQELHSPAGYSVAESVAQGRYAFGAEPFAHTREAVEHALARTDAQHLADREVSELSGGEKRRVALARALAQEPRLLLLDEPNAHLDMGHQRELANLVCRLVNEGMGAIVAVHDLDWAAQLKARPFVLKLGNGYIFDDLTHAQESGALREAYGSNVVNVRDNAGHERWLAEL